MNLIDPRPLSPPEPFQGNYEHFRESVQWCDQQSARDILGDCDDLPDSSLFGVWCIDHEYYWIAETDNPVLFQTIINGKRIISDSDDLTEQLFKFHYGLT